MSMLGFASRVMSSVVSRTAVALALTLSASAGMIIAGAVPQASACAPAPADHCYARWQNDNTANNHGIYGEVDVHCLYEPNNGTFATNEMWDGTRSSPYYWVEVGIYSGAGYNIPYGNKNWYWADSRPNGGYHEHDQSVVANLDTAYPAEIAFAGSGTWQVYGDNSFILIGTSTSQTNNLNWDIAGSEYTSGSTSGIRDQGNIYNLERENTSNNWYSWGSNASNNDNGSGHYIRSTYNSTGSYVSWSGPC